MQKIKRLCALILSAVMCFTIIIGCTNKDTNTDSTNNTNNTDNSAGVTIKSPEDFKGHIIAVQNSTTSHELIQKQLDAGEVIDVRPYEKVTQCFDDLKLGRVDAVYVDSVVAAYYLNGSTGYQRTWISGELEPIGICLDKNSVKLCAAIEAAVDTLYYNGKMAQIAEKHFGDNFSDGLRDVKQEPQIPEFPDTVNPGTLTVGTEIGYPPMEYTTENGQEYIGFDIDVAAAIAEILGLEVKYVNTSWDGIFEGLGKKQYDCVISAVSITEDRKNAYLLTEPYVANAQCIVTLK